MRDMTLKIVAANIFLLLAVLTRTRASSFCQQVVEPLGYGCTEFTLQTSDGFLLVIHRLSKSNSLSGDSGARSTAGAPGVGPAGDRHVPEASGSAASPIINSSNSSGGPPSQSKSPNRNSSNRSSELPESSPAAGSHPSGTQTPSRSPSTGIKSPSNYSVDPGTGNGPPVLLMHQEFFNGQTWFEFVDGNNSSSGLLPIMLLNDGFDVWIGHSRATYWGHDHVYFQSTDREYWNWTWDAHVQFDLPAQLRFILSATRQPIHLVASSQAATVGAAAATDHELAQMIRSLTLIGPTVYRGYTNSILLEAWAYYFGLTLDSEYLVTGFQDGGFNYSLEFPQTGPFSAQGLTEAAIDLISGPNCCLSDIAPIQFTNGWDGTTSFKNLLHWQQGIRMNIFARYDYGTATRNRLVYGQPAPPDYSVAQIPRRLPILLIGGGQDYEAPPHGIRQLLSQLQQPAVFINLTNYAHYDLGFSIHRQGDMYLPILRFLEGPSFQ